MGSTVTRRRRCTLDASTSMPGMSLFDAGSFTSVLTVFPRYNRDVALKFRLSCSLSHMVREFKFWFIPTATSLPSPMRLAHRFALLSSTYTHLASSLALVTAYPPRPSNHLRHIPSLLNCPASSHYCRHARVVVGEFPPFFVAFVANRRWLSLQRS